MRRGSFALVLRTAVLLTSACTCSEPGASAVEPAVVEPTPSLPEVPVLPTLSGEIAKVEAAVEGDATAIRALADECDRGITRSCVELAAAWERGDGVRASEAEARRLYRAACRRAGEECLDAARVHADQAGPYFERGCEAGLTEACRRWAEAMPARADEARARGCTLGWVEACTERVEACGGPLSRCVERARAMREAQPTEARRLAAVACRDGAVAGCGIYAELMRETDALTAQVAYQWACEAGDAAACRTLTETFELDPVERARTEQRLAAIARAGSAGGAGEASAEDAP